MSVSKMLRGHELFRSLSFEDVDRISGFSGVKEFQKNESVFIGGVVGSHLFVLLEGSVILCFPAADPEGGLIVGRIKKGEMFGLATLLGEGRYTVTARCAEPCKVLTIEAAHLREILEQNPAVGLHIMRTAARAYFTRYIETLKRIHKAIGDIADI